MKNEMFSLNTEIILNLMGEICDAAGELDLLAGDSASPLDSLTPDDGAALLEARNLLVSMQRQQARAIDDMYPAEVAH